jgi:hypothetical protein
MKQVFQRHPFAQMISNNFFVIFNCMPMKPRHFLRSFFLMTFCVMLFQGCQQKIIQQPSWPEVSREAKPWSRWWWQGSAVTKEGITAELVAFKKAGLGGLEITPIYGVYGSEGKFVNYLTTEWMALFIHTLREAERLDLGIDMATGTGWPFGGPWVKSADACKNIEYRVYDLNGGEKLEEKIVFIQEPYFRAVGNHLYKGSVREVSGRVISVDLGMKNLIQPIEANRNLQAWAVDQVKFERTLTIKALRGYSEDSKVVDLVDWLDSNGKLNWTAPAGHWKIYAVFEGSHGKMVERAGPGGEGNVIDHFSKIALENYLVRFDSAMKGHDIKSLRAFFNDSYEVDDARGAADWTPALFDVFKEKRGYDLRDHLPALFNKDVDAEKNERILCDYRETIAELVLDNFTLPWKNWAHKKDAIIRNQAHGSPANILDLYSVVDVPEIEGVEPLRIKMASSAGNVSGKKLVSSESATWLNEHFESNLSDIKRALDLFLLNGVNHIFYHGTCYSPQDDPWPGWLFYAAVHLNQRNPLWTDFATLNNYVTRCQSVLQNTRADHDVLLYFPIYDRFSTHGPEMIEHFDGVGKQFENTAFERSASFMLEHGYSYDFISDKQIANLVYADHKVKTEGGGNYKTIVIPRCKYIPLKTLSTIQSLAAQGATVIMHEGYPQSLSGFADLERGKDAFSAMVKKMSAEREYAGRILAGDDLLKLLATANVQRETMVDVGIHFERKINAKSESLYFIANVKTEPFNGWVPLNANAPSVLVQDPMSGQTGLGKIRVGGNGKTEVYVQLQPDQSLFLTLKENTVSSQAFPFFNVVGDAIPLNGRWTVSFEHGGPVLPSTITTSSLTSWTQFSGEGYTTFSGTAKYTMKFSRPSGTAGMWLLDLGKVNESASVKLNGEALGTLIGPAYQLLIDDRLLKEQNILEIYVSNLMANRIADMDKRNIPWKKFYNVNFPARKSENRVNDLFDASHWMPHASGLMGPVSLTRTSPQ